MNWIRFTGMKTAALIEEFRRMEFSQNRVFEVSEDFYRIEIFLDDHKVSLSQKKLSII